MRHMLMLEAVDGAAHDAPAGAAIRHQSISRSRSPTALSRYQIRAACKHGMHEDADLAISVCAISLLIKICPTHADYIHIGHRDDF